MVYDCNSSAQETGKSLRLPSQPLWWFKCLWNAEANIFQCLVPEQQTIGLVGMASLEVSLGWASKVLKLQKLQGQSLKFSVCNLQIM